MACGAEGRFARAANLLSECGRFLLDPEEANAIIDQMERIVRQDWHSVARAAGVSEADCEAIRRAYVYPGFRS
jgi:serine/threonine-protein kinase HipA